MSALSDSVKTILYNHNLLREKSFFDKLGTSASSRTGKATVDIILLKKSRAKITRRNRLRNKVIFFLLFPAIAGFFAVWIYSLITP